MGGGLGLWGLVEDLYGLWILWGWFLGGKCGYRVCCRWRDDCLLGEQGGLVSIIGRWKREREGFEKDLLSVVCY